jgi:hypothetical protein
MSSEYYCEQLPSLDAEHSAEALEAIDEVVKLYMNGVRKVERRILSVPERNGIFHQENVAEHSWSVSLAVRTLWENRSDLALTFGNNFNIGLALAAADVHDVAESIAGDIDAMSEDPNILAGKDEEEEAFREIEKNNKYLGWLAEQKDRPEFKFSSDVDKHIGTRVICRYAPYRWWGFAGEITTREKHERIMRQKMRTQFGHTLYDEILRDFDNREAVKKERNQLPLFPPNEEYANLVRSSFLHKSMMGYRIWPDKKKRLAS